MKLITENLNIILAGIAVGLFTAYGINAMLKLPTETKKQIIVEWLKDKVFPAEQELGSKTGALKLSKVYGWFVSEVPWLAKFVTYKDFSGYVDEALEWLSSQLASNQAVKDKLEGKE